MTYRAYVAIGRFSAGTIAQRFGSWNKALAVAGLDSNQEKNVTPDVLFENLRKVWVAKGKQPVIRDMATPPSRYRGELYAARFGSWRDALRAFVSFVNSDDWLSEDRTEIESSAGTKILIQVCESRGGAFHCGCDSESYSGIILSAKPAALARRPILRRNFKSIMFCHGQKVEKQWKVTSKPNVKTVILEKEMNSIDSKWCFVEAGRDSTHRFERQLRDGYNGTGRRGLHITSLSQKAERSQSLPGVKAGLPFLDMTIAEQEEFDDFIGDVFATDQRRDPQGND